MPIRFLLVGLLFSWGCASTPKVKETPVTESTVQEDVPVDLKACPCGRSDWEQLPPGHKNTPK